MPLLLLAFGHTFSQSKALQATKISQPPKIDGLLNDEAWQNVPIATDFIQNFPNAGQPATQRTVVKVLYDDAAVYVGAYMYDDPALIRKQITARDEETMKDLDYFSVFFDTYKDLQNGFQFLVTTSNVQTDARLAPNLPLGYAEYGDKTWDAVWNSKVNIVEDGWIAEIRIPYTSLRFSPSKIQDWGLQFLRSVRRNNETTFWNNVDPKENGFVNQFGLLKSLENIKPPLRLSFSPYVSTGVSSIPENGTYRTEWLRSGGMDVKYGINESFTLDATLIPDFGQVLSDNVVNNLTPYEVRFEEYRPFFTEGTEIFNKAGLFYSRRIGATPSGYYGIKSFVESDPDLEILKNPGRIQLYNGIKFSGRTKKKLGIGVFNAVTAPMYATIRNKTSEVKEKIQTEPLSNYNIVVLDQALKGRSFVTFTNTNVIRSGGSRDANVTGVDFSFYDATNTMNIRGYGHYSKVFNGNSYDGYNTNLRLGKVSGKIQYYVQNIIRSDGYDPRDMGYIQTANEHVNSGQVTYNQFTPTKNLLSYRYSIGATYRRIYKPDEFNNFAVEASGFWYLKNFWDITLRAGYLPDQHDYFVIGAPFDKYARRPAYSFASLTGSSDSRKQLFFDYELLFADFHNVKQKTYHILSGGLRYRFSDKFTLSLSHRHETETDYIINTYMHETNGDPIIAFVDFKDVTSIISGIYNFTSRINLTLRARHYWSNVVFNRLANVDNEGREVPRPFISGLDQNVNYFNVDAFFTWDFRLGSRLIIGYKNWLGVEEFVDGSSNRRYFKNLRETFDLRHGNEVTVRFIYYLDYNQLKRSRIK